MAFVMIDRQMFDHWLWKEKPFDKARAWLDLIQLAKHKDEKFLSNGVLVDGKRGNIYRSQDDLAERWGWSKGKVRRFLKMLEDDGMICKKSVRYGTVNGTVITLVNYRKFQGERTSDGTVNGTVNELPTNSQRTVNGTHTINIKNINNSEKEDNMPSAEDDKRDFWGYLPKPTDEESEAEGYF